MKIFIPFIALIVLLSACKEPKMKLRAPERETAQKTTVRDSATIDTTKIAVKN